MKWSWQILIFVGIFAFIVMLSKGGGGCQTQQPVGAAPGAKIVTVTVAGRPTADEKQLSPASFAIQAEVADTEQTRKQGLIGRGGLAPGCGILYVYPEPQKPQFVWSTMSFPVSDAFLSPDGTILAVRDAAAHDSATYTPDAPAKFVLEVRRGWFEDRGLKAGDKLVLPSELTGQVSATPAQTKPEIPSAPQ